MCPTLIWEHPANICKHKGNFWHPFQMLVKGPFLVSPRKYQISWVISCISGLLNGLQNKSNNSLWLMSFWNVKIFYSHLFNITGMLLYSYELFRRTLCILFSYICTVISLSLLSVWGQRDEFSCDLLKVFDRINV